MDGGFEITIKAAVFFFKNENTEGVLTSPIFKDTDKASLHGNTASSKISELLMLLYAENFRCILIDFLGGGQSD